jgi:hypothetical protein
MEKKPHEKFNSNTNSCYYYCLDLWLFWSKPPSTCRCDVRHGSFDVSSSQNLVYLTGICLPLAAIAFIINRYAKAAGYLLAVMLLIIIFTIHVPGMMHAADEGSKMMFTTNAIKDLGLAMTTIIIANISRQ